MRIEIGSRSFDFDPDCSEADSDALSSLLTTYATLLGYVSTEKRRQSFNQVTLQLIDQTISMIKEKKPNIDAVLQEQREALQQQVNK